MRRRIHDFRESIQRYAYLETAFIVACFMLFGYLVNPDNICMIDAELSYLTVMLALITLFHGLGSGLLAMGLVGGAMYLYYPSFLYIDFLKQLVLVLVFGEFHAFWTRRIAKYSTQTDYLNAKLDELSKAFYTLKISHDQLEKNYVVKPMSLRNSLIAIKRSHSEEGAHFDSFITLLEKSFNVAAGTLCTVEKERITPVAQTDNAGELDRNDLLIQRAIEKRKPIYISGEVTENSRYVAAIPALNLGKPVGLLLIEQMPFMAFNKDNLISIAILMEFFFDETHKTNFLAQFPCKLDMFDDAFRFEYFRLKKLKERFGTNSTVLVFDTQSELLAHRLYERINTVLRSLDIVAKTHTSKGYFIVLLFPFADRSSASGFINRLIGGSDDTEFAALEPTFFDMDQSAILEEFLLGEAPDA